MQRSHPSLRLALPLLIAFTLAGCTGPISDNVGSTFRKNWIAAHTGANPPYADIDTVAARNEFIDGFVLVKDIEFQNYVVALRRGTSYGELGADGARLVLDGLASVTGGAAVKAGLAAGSAGITGFTGAVKKDVLFDESLPVFIDKMVGLRATKRADILSKESLGLSEYTPIEAYADVEEYGALGTFDAALRSINSQTGQDTVNAKATLAAKNGDSITANTLRGSYAGPIKSETVKVGPQPIRNPVDVRNANVLRYDMRILDTAATDQILKAAPNNKFLAAEIDTYPRNDTPSRSYLFKLIDAANADQLAGWSAIIPARPPPAATPAPSASGTPGPTPAPAPY